MSVLGQLVIVVKQSTLHMCGCISGGSLVYEGSDRYVLSNLFDVM
jgi:hypothetical protein